MVCSEVIGGREGQSTVQQPACQSTVDLLPACPFWKAVAGAQSATFVDTSKPLGLPDLSFLGGTVDSRIGCHCWEACTSTKSSSTAVRKGAPCLLHLRTFHTTALQAVSAAAAADKCQACYCISLHHSSTFLLTFSRQQGSFSLEDISPSTAPIVSQHLDPCLVPGAYSICHPYPPCCKQKRPARGEVTRLDKRPATYSAACKVQDRLAL